MKTINHCPACRYKFDDHTHLGNECLKPKVGDLSICINCLEILRFEDDLQLKIADINKVDQKMQDTLATTLIELKRFKDIRNNGR